MDNRIIASWVLCNTASLNVHAIAGDYMLVGINNNSPIWRQIDYYVNELTMEYERGINFYNTIYFLGECIRV